MRKKEGPSGYERKPVRAFFRRAAPLLAAVSISCAPARLDIKEPAKPAKTVKTPKKVSGVESLHAILASPILGKGALPYLSRLAKDDPVEEVRETAKIVLDYLHKTLR